MADQIFFQLPEEHITQYTGSVKLEVMIPFPVPVKAGQVIGIHHAMDTEFPEPEGTPWTIPQEIKRDQLTLDGLTFTEDDPPKMVAKKDGFLTVMDGKLRVSSVYEFHRDISARLGNVSSQSSILIHGSVSQGVEVISEGDIEVRGLVEDAVVRAKGNIVAKGGVTGGDYGILEAGGSLYCQFAQQARLEAVGDVLVDGSLMGSTVISGKKVVVRKRGLLIGGKIMAAHGVEAGQVGSPGAIPTEIELGSNPFKKLQVDRLDAEITKRMKDIETVQAGIKHMEKEMKGRVQFMASDPATSLFSAAELVQKEGDDMNEDEIYTINKFGSGIMRLLRVKNEVNALKEDLKHLGEDTTRSVTAKLVVRSVINPGVTIRIHGATFQVTREYDRVSFFYDPGKGEIVTGDVT